MPSKADERRKAHLTTEAARLNDVKEMIAEPWSWDSEFEDAFDHFAQEASARTDQPGLDPQARSRS